MPPLGPRLRKGIKDFLESEHLGKDIEAHFGRTTFSAASVRQGRGMIGLPNHHVNYESGLSNEEINRFSVGDNNKLQVWMLEAQLKGGGTDNNVSVEVYDASDSTSLASVTAGGRKKGGEDPLGTSTPGATILVRISTGGVSPDLCITGITSIVM